MDVQRVVSWVRRFGGFAVAAGLLVVMAPLVASVGPAGADPGPAPPSKQRTILNDGHTDVLDLQFVGGELKLRTRMGNPPFEFVPASDVLFQLKDIDGLSRFPIPDDPQFAFLGAPGTPVWIAPQDNIEGLLFAGWDTESVLPGTLAGDAVDIHLISVSGPGPVEVFQNGTQGEPLRVFSSQDQNFRTLHQQVAAHVHANWVFSALGRYSLTFEATGADPSGRQLSSGPVTYTWFVGGTAASDVPAEPTSATLAVSPPSAEVGQEVTLTGTVTPADAPGWIEFHDGDGVLGHAAVSGGEAVFTTTGLAGGSHQLTARFVPGNATDHQASTSPPVTYQVSGTGGGPTSTTTTTSTTSTSTTTTAATSTSESPSTTTTTTTSCVPAPQPVGETAVVLNNGHVDYAARILGGALRAQIKDGTVAGTTTFREPSRVVFHVVSAAAITVPANGFGFLGPAGSQVWQIPQTQRDGILWLGWNTEEITAAQARGGVTWTLDRVEGPGALAVYLFSPFGQPQIVFNSGDGVPDTFEVPLGTHAHGNWAFTKEGSYKVTFTYSVTLASGTRVRDQQVVTFAVGATNPDSALPAAVAQNSDGSGSCAIGTNAARLASTGAPVTGPLTIGGLAVLVGVLTLIAVRRRGSSTVDGE
jgi:putative ABC transporter-associated repeat protein